jgi:hypothetical protein
MEKRLRILIITLLFIALFISLIKGSGGVNEKEVTTKDRVIKALIGEGIPPTDVIISNGQEVKKAFNIQGPDPPNTSRVALVIYAKPPQLPFPEGINEVVFTTLSADETLEGVLAFDTTHRGTDLSTATIIYASRSLAEQLKDSGMGDIKVYNQWQGFEISKRDVASTEEIIADYLSHYDVDVRAIGVFPSGKILVPINDPSLGEDSRLAYIEFMPSSSDETKGVLEALLIIRAAYEADPTLHGVLVNDVDRMARTGNFSGYYVNKEAYQQIDYDKPAGDMIGLVTFIDHPVGG